MATSRSPATVRPITLTPGSRVLDVSTTSSKGNGRTPHSDESIWKRLRDAGFDEESIRRRDKAALIAYIAKLEAEIYDLQHNMGLLILERKDYAAKYEEARLSAESAEVTRMRDQAALSSALAEAKKREDNLKKALGVEKECVANIEKALHEMRAECAEVKIAAESKMAEARIMVEDAQRKYIEAEAKLHAAESLQEEARRSERAASRKLQEVEAREDDLRRRLVSFKSECDAKEKEMMLERQSLMERQRSLSEAQKKVLDEQALLNQREAEILNKSQVLRRVEKDMEAEKENIMVEHKALMEQKCNLELNAVSLSEREKAISEKEASLIKKELDILASQEKLASKEHSEVQRIIAEQENILKSRQDEFEAELLLRQKAVEEEIETKRRAWELRELDLKQREDLILEKEQDLDVQSRVITDKGKDLTEKIKSLEAKESHLKETEKDVEQMKTLLQKEREQIDQAKIGLEKSLRWLEEEKKQTAEAKKELELMRSETSELMTLETKLKEEIDMIRAQKQQLEAEAEKLKVEKAKFETEWESIDEKREELRRGEERIAGERLAISKFLKDERDSLNLEKEALREQYKRDLESLSHDREAFRRESEHERSEWFSKFQQERADFLLEIECQKRQLEDSVSKRREDIESYLREKERSFQEEMKRDLEYISSLKEDLLKEQDRVSSELKKLTAEKVEIKLDREQREKAWAELQSLIEELQMQRLKLKEQRELLHADREAIYSQIEQLQKLEDIKLDSDRIVVPFTQQTHMESTPQVIIQAPELALTHNVIYVEDNLNLKSDVTPGSSVSFLKKCTSFMFKPSPDKLLDPECEDGNLESAHIVSTGKSGQSSQTVSEEPKVIHEVPSVGDVTEMHDLEMMKDVRESSIPHPSGTPTGRKRRVDDSSAPLSVTMLLDDEKINKRRRQETVDVTTPPECMEFKQPCVGEDQNILGASNQSEAIKEKEAGSADGAETPEGDPGIAAAVPDAGKGHAQFRQNEVGKSGVEDGETLRRLILEQTVLEEVVIVDSGEVNKSLESMETSKLKEQEHQDLADKNPDKPETINDRIRTRSKSKQKP